MIFASADWVKASKPTPAALAARAYMLSCRWIDSERLAGVRGRERSISPPNRRHYCPLGVAASQSAQGDTTRPNPIDVMVRLRRFLGGKRFMRRSTCCLLVILFGSWLSSFGQSTPKLTSPKIVATFQRLGLTADLPPTTIYTPKNW